jgi:hypothetical protein
MANAPLRDRTAVDIDLIWVWREGKYFCSEGWTGGSKVATNLPVRQAHRLILTLQATQLDRQGAPEKTREPLCDCNANQFAIDTLAPCRTRHVFMLM